MKPAYLRMLNGLKEEHSGEAHWSIYLLRCGDGSLYTGIAKDVELRLGSHQRGKGAAYTRTHLPVALVYQETCLTRSQALIREAEVKRWPRLRKEQLVASGVTSKEPCAVMLTSTPKEAPAPMESFPPNRRRSDV